MLTVYAGSQHGMVMLGEVESFTQAYNLAWREHGNTISGFMTPNCYTWAYCMENGHKTIIYGKP